MEVTGLVLATVSIASICQTCLHGYRTLNVAIASSDCALTLGVLFRLEECRLYLWGRNWGLVRQMQDITSFNAGEKPPDEQQNDTSQSLDDIDALLEIPGLRSLVMDMLARINDVLEKWHKTMVKYTIPIATENATNDTTMSIAEVSKQQRARVKKSRKGTSFTRKMLWAVKDRGELEELLSTLVSLNDGLENLLPRVEKESLRRGLAGEFLSTLGDDVQSTTATVSSDSEGVSIENTKAARILSVRKQNLTENDEDPQNGAERFDEILKYRRRRRLYSSSESEGEDLPHEEELQAKAPFSANATKRATSTWEIPLADFQHLLEPQLDYHHAKTEHVDFRGPENYVPLPRSFCLYVSSKTPAEELVDNSAPNTASQSAVASADNSPDQGDSNTSTGDASNSTHSSQSNETSVVDAVAPTEQETVESKQEEPTRAPRPPIVVLIEWRLQKAESSRSQLSKQELMARREHVVSLLHRTAVADEDFRVLDCLGYTLAAGFTPDGKRLPLVGFVYRYPLTAAPNALPTTLRAMLDEAYGSDQLQIPSLEQRIQLAKALSIALYQLQCAGWIHRKISSYNILFFRDRVTGEVDITTPFLSGWQYSRPDDQMFQHQSEYSGQGIGDLDMYVHPARLVARSSKLSFPRFRRSYDIYSLGVVLLEVAFWEPIFVLGSPEDREKMKEAGKSDSGRRSREWRARYIEVTRQEMAAEVGSTYRDVVLKCLQGVVVEAPEREVNRRGMPSDSFEEPGLEKDFFWNVVRPLGRVRL